MYAIVRCGGRQEKVAVDDVITVDTLAGEVGSSVTLPAVLVVDDGKVISDPAELDGYRVTAEIMGAIAGPKINMIHYRNKTGYRRRLGHRQRYSQVKITGITAGKRAATKAAAAKPATPKASPAKQSGSGTARAGGGRTSAAAGKAAPKAAPKAAGAGKRG